MKTYYIFRHGETFATKKQTWYWHKLYSARILEEGKPKIIKLANYLKNIDSDYNVCSPFLRCRETAEIVTGITGKVFETDSRIREYAFELPIYFKRRVLRFLKDMEYSDKKTIIICTHAIVIQMIIQYLTTKKISLRDRLKAPLPGVLNIIENGKLKEIDFNK